MKKTIAFVLAMLMLLGILAGCAKAPEKPGDTGSESTGSSVPETENVTLPDDSKPEDSQPTDPLPSESVPEQTEPEGSLPPVSTDPGGYGPIF